MPELTPEQALIRETVRRLCREEIEPLAARIDAEDWFPREIFVRLGEIGALGVLAPEAYGGSGGDYLTAALIMEELARVSGSVALSYGAHAVLCVGAIARDADEDQMRRVLPDLCSGEAIGAWALTEPDSGSDALSMRTRAEPKDGPNSSRTASMSARLSGEPLVRKSVSLMRMISNSFCQPAPPPNPVR